jgi:photosystem II stability/assembly factor-like uncharacterized protein
MWRMAAVACVAVCFALPAPAASAGVATRPVGPPAGLGTLAFAPAAGSTRVYATSPRGFWRSDDDGQTWTSASPKLAPDPYECTYSVSPLNADWIYSGDCSVVSHDAGRTWIWTPALDTTPRIDAAGTLYSREYNTHGLVHRCTPDVSTCANVLLPGGQDLPEVDPASRGLLVDSLFRSTDGGATWSPISPPTGMVTYDFAFDGHVPGKLIAVGRDIDSHELFAISPDAGLTWGAVHSVPLATHPDDESEVWAGGVGALSRIWVQTDAGTVWTADGGVTFHTPPSHPQIGALTVDPNDGTHIFSGGSEQLIESHDAGSSWTLRNAPQFGFDLFQHFTGSGSTLYVTVSSTLWSTHDMGLTWTPVAALDGDSVTSVLASRDDPRSAYAMGAAAGMRVFWATADGGQTWVTHVPPTYGESIDWIQSGHPDWLLVGQEQSLDAGATWTYLDGVDPRGVTPFVLIDTTTGARFTTAPLGVMAADGSIARICAPQDTSCGSALYGGDAWVAGGHTTFATRDVFDDVWAMRDGGRWWRISTSLSESATQVPQSSSDTSQPAPNDHFAVIGLSYVVDDGLLVELTAPPLQPPAISATAGVAHCSTTLTTDDADLAYAWRRDGVAIAGAGADHAIVTGDDGHAVSCALTASNAWGSSTAVSASYRVPTAVGAVAYTLTLSGITSANGRLLCSAHTQITWLRDGRAVKGAHGRAYRVRPGDEGHALACESRGADGTPAFSRAVRVPEPRGGQARPPSLTP